MTTLRHLWRDESGFVASTGWILFSAVFIVGVTVGMVALRNQIVQEFGDMAAALDQLDQSFSIEDGASYTDSSSFDDPIDAEPAGLSVQVSPVDEGS